MMKCPDCNGTGESFGSFACSRCMGSGELKETMISDNALLVLSRMVKWSESTKEATSIIVELSTELLRRREADRWIPVSERLPKECEECLLLNKNKSQFVGWLDEASLLMWFDTIEGYVSDDVTHWRPLPEPPEAQA